MDITVGERDRQRATEKLRELVMKNNNRGREEVERKRGMERGGVVGGGGGGVIPERGVISLGGLPERSITGERGLVVADRERPVGMERGTGMDRPGGMDRSGGMERPGVIRERVMEREAETKVGGGMVDRSAVVDRIGILDRDVRVMEREAGGVVMERMLERDARLVEREGEREVLSMGPERLRVMERERVDERDRVRERLRDVDREQGERRDRVVERGSDREESTLGALRELVSQYKSALAELTFNSKPIITNLTIIAGENIHAAKGISATVCAHILEVPKEQKLPSLYLLDSIVKNISGDYVKYFAERLPEVFCKAYRQVDPSTNPAMQHLFRTWRGVFPPAPLRIIETELEISTSAPNGPSGATPPARPLESPMQRPGHSIHVNPEYLKAQRQRLQQSSQAEGSESNGAAGMRNSESSLLRETSNKGWSDPPLKRPMMQRGKRDGFSDQAYGRETPYDYPDYDEYGIGSGRRPGLNSGAAMDRGEGWESGYFREADGNGFGQEEGRGPRGRYGPRNGYDWRQGSGRGPNVGEYGYNRGPGPGRGGSLRSAQPLIESPDGRGRGGSGNWLKEEEEEYVWEDMSPQLQHSQVRDVDRGHEGLQKDDWYPSEADRGGPAGEAGRLKRGLDSRFGNGSGWRREGQMASLDQILPGFDDQSRVPLSSGIGIRESAGSLIDDGPGSSRAGISGISSLGGWPSQPSNSPNLSPQSQSRLRQLQVTVPNRNNSPTSRTSSSINTRSGTPPTPGNGVGPPTTGLGSFDRFNSNRAGLGSFGGAPSPTYNTLSPVTPSNLSFQQQQSHRRPASPSQLPAQLQQTPLAQSQQQVQQPRPQQLHQNDHLRALQQPLQQSQPLQGQHLAHVPQNQVVASLQLQQGSQQPLQPSLLPSQQVQPHQQQSQLPGLQQSQLLPVLQQPQQSQSQTQQTLLSQAPSVLPLIPAQLVQSLQQLSQQQSTQAQSAGQSQQTQVSQPLSIIPPPLTPATVANGPSGPTVQTSQGQSTHSSLLAAILQSGLIPPSQPGSPRASGAISQSTASQSAAFQGQPPLPSGPPPTQFSNSIGIPAAVQNGMGVQVSAAVPLAPLTNMSNFANPQPPRFSQPPLPPGPPPASTIVGSAASQPAPSGGALPSTISSLLSSLVAHGVIGAVPATSVSSGSSSLPVSVAPANSNLSFLSGVLSASLASGQPATAPVISTTTMVATSVSSPQVTSVDASESPPRPKRDPIGVEFKQELLRVRHESVINALYSDFPRQCKTCGLRFRAQDEHSKHMDWHVSRNRRQKSQKKVSRKWFVSFKEWLSGTGAAGSESAPSFFAEVSGAKVEENELVAVQADENQSACALCGEPFEDFYSDETEEWMYKGAVYMNVPPGGSTEGLQSLALGPIVHLKCKTESAETVPADSNEDEEEVQPELQAADSVRMEVDGRGEDSIMPLLAENFDTVEIKEEREDLGSRRKRTRY